MLAPILNPGRYRAAAIAALLCSFAAPLMTQAQYKKPANTQSPSDLPPTALEMVRHMKLPEGFKVDLFAAEPDVRQPIAIDFDDRGRLWVAQCDTYEGGPFDQSYADSILIFTDDDNDGRFDRRQEFWKGRGPLTGLAIGFGGVWALCAGELRWIPDRDRDDRPDGPHEVLLDGWDYVHTRHNVVNGLKWGPDGWLYGRHGITDTSSVGAPGTPPEKRTVLDCCVWRFHPVRREFDVVCRGTTNPWGFDYDDYGEMFFTNNVNGHLWHVLPGARYIRMFGEHPNPYLYSLMGQTADHDHWDTTQGGWQSSRGGTGTHDRLGGGHSHCGGMIYLADRWPAEYRNSIFMCNTHGYRVNRDRLELTETGYRGRHAADFLLTGSPWFRGVSLACSPDGNVFLSDWTDYGECHDHDGVHRLSGRIYKISYGQPSPSLPIDIGRLTPHELVRLQRHPNDWYVRRARRRLQELAAQKQLPPEAIQELQTLYKSASDTKWRLRALWALYSAGALDESWLVEQLGEPSAHLRAWAVRLLVDVSTPSKDARSAIVRLAEVETSPLVRLHLASAMRRMPAADRWALARRLAQHDRPQFSSLTHMIWYGVEPAVVKLPNEALDAMPHLWPRQLVQWTSRRLVEDWTTDSASPPPLPQSLAMAAAAKDNMLTTAILMGIRDALIGRTRVPTPDNWQVLLPVLRREATAEQQTVLRELEGIFANRRDVDSLMNVVTDSSQAPSSRRQALDAVLRLEPEAVRPALRSLSRERVMEAAAIRALQRVVDRKLFASIADRYPSLKQDAREALWETGLSRPEYAVELLDRVARGTIRREDLTAYRARQMHLLGSNAVDEKLAAVWGRLREAPADVQQAIARWKAVLTRERLAAADRSRGRELYTNICGKCHRLYGEGADIGPDLTGGNRKNIDYLLENVLNPSGLIPKGSEVYVAQLVDGRVISGMVTRQTPQVVELQSQDKKIVLDRADIEAMKATAQSLMPTGQLDNLSEQQVVDLVAYIVGG